jgi:Protein of unknown function DUF2625
MPIHYFKALPGLICFTLLLTTSLVAQQNKKTLEELTTTNSGWEHVQSWVDSARNQVEVLPVQADQAKATLLAIQMTTRSPMGAIIFNSGGILVDHGWIRILGSGHRKLNRTLYSWNSEKTMVPNQGAGYFLVADDAIGGYFATNSGALGKDVGKVYYFDPGTLKWEPLDLSYTEFLLFCFNGDLNKFYTDLRWKNWQQEVSKLDGNMVFNFLPPLWSKEGKDINKNSRNAVPVEEQYSFTLTLTQAVK